VPRPATERRRRHRSPAANATGSINAASPSPGRELFTHRPSKFAASLSPASPLPAAADDNGDRRGMLSSRDQVAVADIGACRALRDAAIWPIEVAGSRESPLPKASDSASMPLPIHAGPCDPADIAAADCHLCQRRFSWDAR
jgi:hypothetical protein